MKSPKKIPATIKADALTAVKIALRDSTDTLVDVLDKLLLEKDSLPTIYIHKGKAFQLTSFSFEVALYREVPCEFTQDFALVTMYETEDGRIIISNGDDESNAHHHAFNMNKVKLTRFRSHEEFDIVIETKVTAKS